MTKRIKPGFAATIGVASDMVYIHERDGELVIDGGLSASQTEALAAALADAVEDAPRELWEDAKLAHDFHAVRAERFQWQRVVDAVLAAHAERDGDDTVTAWAVRRDARSAGIHGTRYLASPGNGWTTLASARTFDRKADAEDAARCHYGDVVRVVIRGRVER
jgi:hypothetical protein